MAFRPGSAIGDVTPDLSVDVSAWGEAIDLHHDSTIVNDLDRPVDLTGHILSPFYQRELIHQDCKFQSINFVTLSSIIRRRSPRVLENGPTHWWIFQVQSSSKIQKYSNGWIY